MKDIHTSSAKKINYKIWVVSFLAAIVLVFVINWIAGYGNPSTAFVQTASKNSRNEQPCSYNKQDTCVMAPSVDLYPSGKEDATNPILRNQKSDEWKTIGGVVTGTTGREMQIRTSSNRAFAITFPLAVQDWWNEVRGPHYDNYKMGVGDTVRIDYLEPADQASTTINPDQLMHSVIAINLPDKDKPIQRYLQ